MRASILLTRITIIISIIGFSGQANAALIEFSWSGQVESVTEFGSNSLPSNIAVGDSAKGSASFEQTGFDKALYIRGTNTSGYRYDYFQGMRQTLAIGDLQWVVDAGSVQLIDTDFEPRFSWRALDISHFEQDGVIEFPGLLSSQAIGFALFEEKLPYDLFSSYQLASTTFDFSAMSFGNGSVTTSERNQQRDIVNGYSITYSISKVFVGAVPVPSSVWLLCVGFLGLSASRQRNRKA